MTQPLRYLSRILFTALTRVFGLGEAGPKWQPQHQHWYDFARLLFEAGADPNDNQGLYNRIQYPDNDHLKWLLEYGLARGQGGLWFNRFFRHWPLLVEHAGYPPRIPPDILAYQFRWAIESDWFDRVPSTQMLQNARRDAGGDSASARRRFVMSVAVLRDR